MQIMQARLAAVVIHLQQEVLGDRANQRESTLAQHQRHHPLPFRRRSQQVAPHALSVVFDTQQPGDGRQQIGQPDRLVEFPRAQQPRRMNQQRHVVAFQSQLIEGRLHVVDIGNARIVITKHHEDGVVVITACLGHLHETTDIEIQQPCRIVLLDAARASGLHLFQRSIDDLETVIVLGNGEGTVVARGLDVGEEGLVLRQVTQQLVGLLEQIQVGNTPHIHIPGLPVTLFVELNPIDALAHQGVHVGPAGVAADGVQLVVALQFVDQAVLVGDQRVAGSGFGP